MNNSKTKFEDIYEKFSKSSKYYENLEIENFMNKIYSFSTPSYPDDYELKKLRNNNHKIYTSIDLIKLSKLPEVLQPYSKKIINAIKSIKEKDLLKENMSDAQYHAEVLKNIQDDMKNMDKAVRTTLKELIKSNDKNLAKINIDEIDIKHKERIERLYNDVILTAVGNTLDDYEDLFIQLDRKEKIMRLFDAVNKYDIEWKDKKEKEKIAELNAGIDDRIAFYREKINYLKDLLMEQSRYQNKLISFTYYFDEKITYNKSDIKDVKKMYDMLQPDNIIDNKISKLENLFSQERELFKKENEFAKEKTGRTNLKNTLRYLKNYYNKKLTKKELEVVENNLGKVDTEDINILKESTKKIVDRIWKKSITDIYNYNVTKDYYFIVSKTPFKEENFETILITKKMIEKVNIFDDFEIGFICNYDDNILLTTENNEIPSIIYDDLSNLKTPIQLEQEFVNFKVCNRLALNGYKTDIIGVYYIDTKKRKIYEKAVKLANEYDLPLIRIIKN